MISSPIVQKRTSTTPFAYGEYGIPKCNPKTYWPLGRPPMFSPRPTSVNDWLWVRAAVAYALFCGDGSVELTGNGSIGIEIHRNGDKSGAEGEAG